MFHSHSDIFDLNSETTATKVQRIIKHGCSEFMLCLQTSFIFSWLFGWRWKPHSIWWINYSRYNLCVAICLTLRLCLGLWACQTPVNTHIQKSSVMFTYSISVYFQSQYNWMYVSMIEECGRICSLVLQTHEFTTERFH